MSGSRAEHRADDLTVRLTDGALRPGDRVGTLEADADYELFLRRNWELHAQIAQLCDNAMIRAVYSSCLGYLREGRATYAPDTSPAAYVAARAQLHHELVEAVIAGEPEPIRRAVARHHEAEAPSTERVVDER